MRLRPGPRGAAQNRFAANSRAPVSRIFTGIQWVAWPSSLPSSLMSSIDAAALAPVHRRVWQNNRPRRPPPMTSSTGNRSDGHGLCHGLDSAPAPRMSAPTQSHAPTCARAARGRAGRAIFIIRTHGNSCCRVRVAHRGHKPSLFAAHERECRMLTALCPIDGARAPPPRTLFRQKVQHAFLHRSVHSNSAATLTSIDRPLTRIHFHMPSDCT